MKILTVDQGVHFVHFVSLTFQMFAYSYLIFGCQDLREKSLNWTFWPENATEETFCLNKFLNHKVVLQCV